LSIRFLTTLPVSQSPVSFVLPEDYQFLLNDFRQNKRNRWLINWKSG